MFAEIFYTANTGSFQQPIIWLHHLRFQGFNLNHLGLLMVDQISSLSVIQWRCTASALCQNNDQCRQGTLVHCNCTMDRILCPQLDPCFCIPLSAQEVFCLWALSSPGQLDMFTLRSITAPRLAAYKGHPLPKRPLGKIREKNICVRAVSQTSGEVNVSAPGPSQKQECVSWATFTS